MFKIDTINFEMLIKLEFSFEIFLTKPSVCILCLLLWVFSYNSQVTVIVKENLDRKQTMQQLEMAIKKTFAI